MTVACLCIRPHHHTHTRIRSLLERLLKHCVKHNALPVAKDAMSAHYANEEIQLSGIQLIQCYLEKGEMCNDVAHTFSVICCAGDLCR